MKNCKNIIVYQIYPSTFYDSNGDGIGDLKGITEKLDYVKDLGVNTVWLNPIYKSPFKDGGYDIEDYYSIDERFGTFEDFDALINKANKLGLKICLDLVIGHTSWNCEWFKKSAVDEKNKYSDYYIWTTSCFTTYKNKTISGLYDRNGCYYANYYACQPALNYGFNNLENSDSASYSCDNSWRMHYTDERLRPLREEIYNIIHFWMNKGVAGFRVDLANSLVKDCVFDSDNDKDIEGLKWFWNEFFSVVRKEYPDILFISEWCYPKNSVGKCGFDIDIIAHDNYYWNDLFRNEKGSNLFSFFEKGHNYFSKDGKGTVENFIKETAQINDFIKEEGYFTAPTGSHDEIRLATGKTQDELKCVFAFLLTYKHIPFIYYGDEIGITHNFEVSRDGGYIRTGCRTPMQWNDEKNRGFSISDNPYLPTNLDTICSVDMQNKDENSLLSIVKKLIALRNEYSCLNADSNFELIECNNGGYPFIFERKDSENNIIVAINPSNNVIERNVSYKKVLLTSNCEIVNDKITLKNQGFAILLKE